MAKVTITIEKGQATVKVADVRGGVCRDLTKPFVKLLSQPGTETQETLDPDFDAPAFVNDQATQR